MILDIGMYDLHIPRKRWKDSIREDCQKLLKCRNWEERAWDTEDWRQRIKKARAHIGL